MDKVSHLFRFGLDDLVELVNLSVGRLDAVFQHLDLLVLFAGFLRSLVQLLQRRPKLKFLIVSISPIFIVLCVSYLTLKLFVLLFQSLVGSLQRLELGYGLVQSLLVPLSLHRYILVRSRAFFLSLFLQTLDECLVFQSSSF